MYGAPGRHAILCFCLYLYSSNMERSPSRLIFEHSSYYNSQDMPFTFLDSLIRLLLFRLPRLPSDPSVYTFPVALKN